MSFHVSACLHTYMYLLCLRYPFNPFSPEYCTLQTTLLYLKSGKEIADRYFFSALQGDSLGRRTTMKCMNIQDSVSHGWVKIPSISRYLGHSKKRKKTPNPDTILLTPPATSSFKGKHTGKKAEYDDIRTMIDANSGTRLDDTTHAD